MSTERIKIYADTSSLRIYVLQAYLTDQNIHSEIINKSDRSYGGAFGDFEIYVFSKDVAKALQILEEFLSHGS